MQKSPLNFGWLELCLDCSHLEDTVKFYEKLGFVQIKGRVEYGTVGLVRDKVRITLFGENYLQNEFGKPFLLNFRGGDINQIFEFVHHLRLPAPKTLEDWEDGSLAFRIKDPDDHVIYFDTHPSERKKT